LLSKASEMYLKKDQAQDDVLVLGRVHVVAKRVGGGGLKLGLEAEVGAGVVSLGGFFGGFLALTTAHPWFLCMKSLAFVKAPPYRTHLHLP
jgi:hypothetical protein